MKKIIIPYFPRELKYATPVLFGVAIYLGVIGYSIWAAILVILSAVILTTKYVTALDMSRRMYSDYIFFLGMKLSNESTTFKSIDRIVVTKGSYSQTVNTRVQSRQMNWTDYTGTIIFDGNKTLNLVTRNDKHELMLGLREFAAYLNVRVEDRTAFDHHWVDLTKYT